MKKQKQNKWELNEKICGRMHVEYLEELAKRSEDADANGQYREAWEVINEISGHKK